MMTTDGKGKSCPPNYDVGATSHCALDPSDQGALFTEGGEHEGNGHPDQQPAPWAVMPSHGFGTGTSGETWQGPRPGVSWGCHLAAGGPGKLDGAGPTAPRGGQGDGRFLRPRTPELSPPTPGRGRWGRTPHSAGPTGQPPPGCRAPRPVGLHPYREPGPQP